MGLLRAATEWLIERNESKLNKKKTDDFDLLYRNNLAKVCSQAEIERIKVLYDEWRKLGDKFRANELKPPSSRDINRMIQLDLFLHNNLNTVNPRGLEEALWSLENQGRKSLEKRMQTIERQRDMALEKGADAERLKAEKSTRPERPVVPKDKGKVR